MDSDTEKKLEVIYRETAAKGDNLITVLQGIQREIGYISEETVDWFSRKMKIPSSKFYGVATFYSQFHLSPRGENIITVCSGTVCHVKGAERIFTKLQQHLSLKGDVLTSKDMRFTLENVNCVGACSIAPVIIVNDKVFGKQSPEKMIRNLKPYKE